MNVIKNYIDSKLKRTIIKARKNGYTMLEVMIVVILIVILIGISIGVGVSSRDKTLMTRTVSDLNTYKNAIQQAFLASPELMRYRDNSPSNSIELIITAINEQLDDDWKFQQLASTTGSGGVASTKVKTDSWGNPYGLYVYTNTNTTTYADETGAPYASTDSSIHIVVMSASKNGTGGPMGIDGSNYDESSMLIKSASDMINNTDGVDDLGVIVRMLNGSTRVVTFGYDDANIGALENKIWVLGIPSTTGGKCVNFLTGSSTFTPSMASSVGQYYDSATSESMPETGVIGSSD